MDDGYKTKNMFFGSVMSLGFVECIALTALWAVLRLAVARKSRIMRMELGMEN